MSLNSGAPKQDISISCRSTKHSLSVQTWPTSNTFIPFRLYPSMLCSKLAHSPGPAANCTVCHCKVAIFLSVTSCPLWPQKLVRIDLALHEISFCAIRIKLSLQLPVAPSAIAPCIMPSVSNRFSIKIPTEPHPQPPLRASLPSQALSGHPKGNRLPCALVDWANWPCSLQRTPELYDHC